MIADWQPFFTAIIGTTGALLGLLFVGISMSIPKIITSTGLPRAAAQPLFLLFGVLTTSLFFLVPNQPLSVLGTEVLGASLVVGGAATYNDLVAFREVAGSELGRFLSNFIFNLIPFGLMAASGAFLMAEREQGFYVMLPAIILSFVQATTISWAFLVAIHTKSARARHVRSHIGAEAEGDEHRERE